MERKGKIEGGARAPLVAVVTALVFGMAPWAWGADWVIRAGDSQPPKELSESIRTALKPASMRLMDGEKVALEIWLRQEMPLKSKPASASSLDVIPETALVGAVAVTKTGFKDYKDNDLPQGIFTARMVFQPQDGDHLGTADFNTFLVLIAADTDKDLKGFDKFRPMVKASGKLTSSGHPSVLSLRPASGNVDTPAITNPAPEHKAIRIKLSGKNEAGEKSDLIAELVFEGHGHIQ